MATDDIFETWRQQAIQQGREEGRGMQAADSLLLLYEARFGAVPDDVRGAIEDTRDLATLRGWIQVAGTRSTNEVIAAIRSARPR